MSGAALRRVQQCTALWGLPTYGIGRVQTYFFIMIGIWSGLFLQSSSRRNPAHWPLSSNIGKILAWLLQHSGLSSHLTDWSHVNRMFDIKQSRIPELPEELTRVLGFTINGQTYPGILLSRRLAEHLEYICRLNRKTRRVCFHLKGELEAIQRQDDGILEQQQLRSQEINTLRAKFDAEDARNEQHDVDELNRHEEMAELHAEVEDQRTRWHELYDQITETRRAEVMVHGSRFLTAAILLEHYFLNSGISIENTDAYLEDFRDSTPGLRSYYNGLRDLLSKYRRTHLIDKRDGLDCENETMSKAATESYTQIPSDFQTLAAEYHCKRHDVALAQAEFDDRAQTNWENKFAWEEARAHGEYRPSREEFDLSYLQEDMRKTRNLREAEVELARLRRWLGNYVPMSDVNGDNVPVHATPVKSKMNIALIRAAQSSDKIEEWHKQVQLERVKPDTTNSGPPHPRDVDQTSWEAESLRPEDSFSITERDPFLIARKCGWKKIQEARRSGTTQIMLTEEPSPSKRRRESSAEISEYSGESNKRQKPVERDGVPYV